MMDDLECLCHDRKAFFQRYLKTRTPEQCRRFLVAMYHETDPRSGEFTKRHYFQFPPTTFSEDELRDHDGPKRRDRPAMSDEAYEFYTDGVRSDSDEGRARSKRNAAEVKRLLDGGGKQAWDYLNGREIDEVVAMAEPGDPHFEMETDTEEVPF